MKTQTTVIPQEQLQEQEESVQLVETSTPVPEANPDVNQEVNPETVLKEKKKAHQLLPKIFMACGTEDFLLEENRAFYEFLKAEQADVQYHETTGTHEWKFWNEYLEPAILWAINK